MTFSSLHAQAPRVILLTYDEACRSIETGLLGATRDEFWACKGQPVPQRTRGELTASEEATIRLGELGSSRPCQKAK
jgi:hypothetical protein